MTPAELDAIGRALDAFSNVLGLIDPEGDAGGPAESEGHAQDWTDLEEATAALSELRRAGAVAARAEALAGLAGRVADLAEWNEGTAYALAIIYRAEHVAARVVWALPGDALETLAEGRGETPAEAAAECAAELGRSLGLWRADQ